MKLKRKLMKINAILGRLEGRVLAVIMALMVLILTYNTFGRFVLGKSLQFAEEAGTVLLVTVSYIGCITAVRKSKHIRMVYLSELIPLKETYILTLINLFIPAVTFFFFGYLCFQIMIINYHSGRSFMTFQMDRWTIWLPVVIGLVGTGIQYIIAFTYNIIDRKKINSKGDIWIGSELTNGDIEECGKEGEGC